MQVLLLADIGNGQDALPFHDAVLCQVRSLPAAMLASSCCFVLSGDTLGHIILQV